MGGALGGALWLPLPVVRSNPSRSLVLSRAHGNPQYCQNTHPVSCNQYYSKRNIIWLILISLIALFLWYASLLFLQDPGKCDTQMNHQVTPKQTVALELFFEAEGAKVPRGPVGTTSALGQSGQVELNQSHAGMSPCLHLQVDQEPLAQSCKCHSKAMGEFVV